MATPFLDAEEFDERAHGHYDRGDYEAAIQTLKDGLRLHPYSVELYVGLGYTRLAREEFVWAKHAFEQALVLEPDHLDAKVGLGEALLRFGRRDSALRLFGAVRREASPETVDLLLAIGRALYRERLFTEAHRAFAEAETLEPESADAAAALAYTLHRLGDEHGAVGKLQETLARDPTHHEARIYLGHVQYDRGRWDRALDELEKVPPEEHWDSLTVWRVIELKRAFHGVDTGSPELARWERRLEELTSELDPIDELLNEVVAEADG